MLYNSEPEFVKVPLTEQEKAKQFEGSTITLSLQYTTTSNAPRLRGVVSEVSSIHGICEADWQFKRLEFAAKLKQEIESSVDGNKIADPDAIQQIIVNKCVEEKISRFFDAVRNSKRLAESGQGVVDVVINFWKALLIVRTIQKKYQYELAQVATDEANRLKQEHPIKSRLDSLKQNFCLQRHLTDFLAL